MDIFFHISVFGRWWSSGVVFTCSAESIKSGSGSRKMPKGSRGFFPCARLDAILLTFAGLPQTMPFHQVSASLVMCRYSRVTPSLLESLPT
eukprot:4638099-Amphidinium_carterae.1